MIRVFPDVPPEELLARYHVIQPSVSGGASGKECFDCGYRQTRALLQQDAGIQGIIYLSDYFAFGGVKYLHEQGVGIGVDVALAGYNNTSALQCFPFPISTADHDIPRICKNIVDNLESEEPCLIRLEPVVVLR